MGDKTEVVLEKPSHLSALDATAAGTSPSLGASVNAPPASADAERWRVREAEHARREHWKREQAPLLYDWMLSRKCLWPSACLQFGSQKDVRETYTERTLYLSERTGPLDDANTLLLASVRVANEHLTRTEDTCAKWSDTAFRDALSYSDFRVRRKIIHPGEVNRVRELRPSVVVSHTDSPRLFIWNFERQPHRRDTSSKQLPLSVPELVLVGHTDVAEYAIDTAERGSSIASGGADCNVLLWTIDDYASLNAATSSADEGTNFSREASTLKPRATLKAHTATVEGLAFNRRNASQLCSVGDDGLLALWDVRQRRAAHRVQHSKDVNCVDWHDDGVLIATGGNDSVIRLWDARALSSPSAATLFELRADGGQVNEVNFQRDSDRRVLASSADSEDVLIWDLDQAPKQAHARPRREALGGKEVDETMLFRHQGHSYPVSEFQWCPDTDDPWLLASISEDDEGATLQLWRLLDLLYLLPERSTRLLQKQF